MNQESVLSRCSSPLHECGSDELLVLMDVLDSAAFDLEREAAYCLSHFHEINWRCSNASKGLQFSELHAMGMSGQLSRQDLDKFVALVALDTPVPIYVVLTQAARLTEPKSTQVTSVI